MAERSHSMPPQRSAVVVDAPSNLGLRPPSPDTIPGCWRLPQALRQAGIVTRLDATDGGRVLPPSYTPDRDATGTRNGLAIAGYSVKLADRLGAVLALCRRGRYGLAYLDGHLDFRHPGNSEQLSAVAGEDLAVVTGRGPEQLAALEDRRPLVRDADVVALGHHDRDHRDRRRPDPPRRRRRGRGRRPGRPGGPWPGRLLDPRRRRRPGPGGHASGRQPGTGRPRLPGADHPAARAHRLRPRRRGGGRHLRPRLGPRRSPRPGAGHRGRRRLRPLTVGHIPPSRGVRSVTGTGT